MRALLVILITIFGYSCGDLLRLREPQASKDSHAGHNHSKKEKKQEYTCAMHPSVKSKNPDDKCPICNMDLVPIEKEGVKKKEDKNNLPNTPMQNIM